jgi:hypothetical protein
MTISTDNGGSYIATNYGWASGYVNTGTTVFTATAVAVDTKFPINFLLGGWGTLANAGSGYIKFSDPSTSGTPCRFFWHAQGAAGANMQYPAAGWNTTTTPINNIKFTADSGNITGNFRLYGIQKS